MNISSPIRRIFAAATLAGMLAFPSLASNALEGTAAPDFALSSLDGPNLRLSEYRGDVVMLNFWATWCGPCRQEMPMLEEIYGRYRPAGFQLLGINVDGEPSRARRMAEDLGVSFPLLIDTDKSVSRLYDIRAMPVTVLIDRDGTVRHVHYGYRPGYERRYLEQVGQLLREE